MKKKINLNPKSLNIENKNTDIIILLIIIIVCGVLLSTYTIFRAVELRVVNKEKINIETNVNNMNLEGLNNNLSKSLNNTQEKIKVLEKTAVSYNPYGYIYAISTHSLKGIEINNVSFNKGNVTLKGETDNENLIPEFLNSLKKDKLFENAELNTITKVNNVVENNESVDTQSNINEKNITLKDKNSINENSKTKEGNTSFIFSISLDGGSND